MDSQNQQSPTPKQFRLSKKYIIIIIIILAFASFGSTTYLLVAHNKNKPAINNSPPPVVIPPPSPTTVSKNLLSVSPTNITPTPTPIIDSTATWSAYLSTKYGYSIKYPTNWTAKNIAQSDPKILEYVVFNPKDSTISGELAITLSYGTRTYQEALALDPQKGEIITVASVSATKKTQKDSDGNITINIIIPSSLRTLIMYAKDKYKDIFNQMLSTLKL